MTMRERWDQLVEKIDGMSLRERALIFAALAFALVSLINVLFLDPLLAQQKRLSSQVVQQQEKMKEIQAQLAALLEARQSDKDAPQRQRMAQLREQLAVGDTYLRETQDRLVPPEKMAKLLEQVLSRNARLQLLALETLPAALFIEPMAEEAKNAAPPGNQIYKHGVRITVRGSYTDLLQYLRALEKLPTRMFWGMAKMQVAKYPETDLTLTLYTLSLDKKWLRI